METIYKSNSFSTYDKKIDSLYINIKNEFDPFAEKERNAPYFQIPMRKTYFKNDISLPEPKKYTPKTEFEKRSDREFYQTFYTPEFSVIMADYDDLIALWTRQNPGAEFSIAPETGKVTSEPRSVSPTKVEFFIQSVLPFGIPISSFDLQGSKRRIEERSFFPLLKRINITGHMRSLMDLQKLGIHLAGNISLEELRTNTLTDQHKKELKAFYRRRQSFWHPDRWIHEKGLASMQKVTIEEMSRRINHLERFVR